MNYTESEMQRMEKYGTLASEVVHRVDSYHVQQSSKESYDLHLFQVHNVVDVVKNLTEKQAYWLGEKCSEKGYVSQLMDPCHEIDSVSTRKKLSLNE